MSDEMDEIWELFADDGAQALDAMEAALLALQDGSAADPAAEIGALFRAVHTFKGNSRVLGLSTVENRAHLSEDLIGLVRDKGVPLNAEILDVLLLSCDTLRTMLEETAATRQDVEPGPSEPLTARLREVNAHSTEPDGAGVPEPSPARVGAIANALAELEAEDESDAADLAGSAAPDVATKPAPALDQSAPAHGPASAAEPAGSGSAAEPPSVPTATAPPARATPPAPEGAMPRRIDDPSYRAIFEKMARDTLAKLEGLAAGGGPDMSMASARAADQLSYAAGQMGLPHWQARIDPFVAQAKGDGGVDSGDIAAVMAGIEALLAAGIATPAAPAPAPADAAAVPDEWDDLPTEPDAAARADVDPGPDTVAPADTAPAKRVEDPAFVEIFNGMVSDTIAKLEKLVAETDPESAPRAARLADQLSYAAGQMGLDAWQAVLDPFVAAARADESGIAAAIRTLCADLDRLRAPGLTEPEPSPAPAPRVVADADPVPETVAMPAAPAPAAVHAPWDDDFESAMTSGTGEPAGPPSVAAGSQDFLAAVQAFYPRISGIALTYREPDHHPDPVAQNAMCDDLAALAAAHGYVALGAAVDGLRHARDAASYRVAELQLYEALVAIERVLPCSASDDMVPPSRLLETWCADTVYDTLALLRDTLDALKHAEARPAMFGQFERLMRLVYHACNHYRMETAAQLSMALLDLFSRVKVENVAPDAMLLHIARGYADTLELVFDALEQGDTPDLANISQLFEEASNACFTSSGVVSARTIEKRLGLPESFHRVLSPDSVRAAQTAIDDRMTFYIVRADLNQDQAKAEAFLDWFGTGRVKMITNVTVFTEDDVLFDFLLASRLGTPDVVEALATIDPSGRNLDLLQTLVPERDDPQEAPDAEPAPPAEELPLSSVGASSTIELIEMIGEMAASQAMVQHMLTALVGRDLVHEIEIALREAGVDRPGPLAWRAVRGRIEDYTDRLMQVADAEGQLSEQVSRIQEAGVAMRSRSAQALLQSLAAFVETKSRGLGKEARLSSEGGDLALDQTILEEMRTHMRALLTMRISGDKPPTRYHVVVMREDDGVLITLEDNGGPLADQQVIDEIGGELAQRSGSLRLSVPPTGGLRFHLMLPLNMAVMDGMVVRVDDVSYVVPLDAIQRIQMCGRKDVLNISADGRTQMLRVSDTEHIPIHELQGARRPAAGHAPMPDEKLFVIVRSAARHVALPVDELLGQQMVLLRPLRGVLSHMRGLTGIALLAGGDVGMVLSVSRLEAA